MFNFFRKIGSGIKKAYQNKTVRVIAAVAEGGALGALAGVPFTPAVFTVAGLKQIGLTAATGAAIALRHYFVDPNKSKTQENAQ